MITKVANLKKVEISHKKL